MLFNAWLLVSEPGKSGLGKIFFTSWYRMEDFDASGPEIRIPGRDLAFERGQVWEGVQIWDKNDRDFEIVWFPKISGQIRFENRDFAEITPAIWISRRDRHIPKFDFSIKHPGPKNTEKSGKPKKIQVH